jgi:hypothetical protein
MDIKIDKSVSKSLLTPIHDGFKKLKESFHEAKLVSSDGITLVVWDELYENKMAIDKLEQLKLKYKSITRSNARKVIEDLDKANKEVQGNLPTTIQALSH